jgi:uncharacterized protein YegP (UPF0339 family)
MSLNHLYHEHGVATTLAQHADSAELRAEHTAEGIRIDDRIRSKRNGRAAVTAQADRFEVFRADEVQVTSTQFAGGDWRWRLADAADNTLVEGGGYPSKGACVVAVSYLRDRASSAN